jgi:hypothetical protein
MQNVTLIDNSPKAIAERATAELQARLAYLQDKAKRLNSQDAMPGHDLDAARKRNAEAIAAVEAELNPPANRKSPIENRK